MTQEELGSRLGINRAAVNKYEKGTVVNIPVNTLLKLCDIFDVTPNYYSIAIIQMLHLMFLQKHWILQLQF